METTNTHNADQESLPSTFAEWWERAGTWVEEPNRRRNGWSGMLTISHGGVIYYVKRQCNHTCRTLTPPFSCPTTRREHDNIVRLRKIGIITPTPVFHGERRTASGQEGILVTEELRGFRALDQQTNLSEEARRTLAAAVGQTLGRLHRSAYQHSCLYPKHIMVRWTDANAPEIALIDLEKLRKHPFRRQAARHDLDQLARHQSLWAPDEWHLLLAHHTTAMAA